METWTIHQTSNTTPKQVKRRTNVSRVLLVLLFLALAPSVAVAGPIEDGVDWVLTLITSGIARSVAIIAIAVLGYMAWAGRLTWERAIHVMVGIVLVFGSATIVDTFIGAVA